MQHLRCSICNGVSTPELANLTSPYVKGTFTPDPDNTLFYLCLPCSEEIKDAIGEDNIMDEVDPDEEFAEHALEEMFEEEMLNDNEKSPKDQQS